MESAYRYQQLEHWLLKGIKERRWQAEERLPSIRALCQQHGLSKATVQHALQRLGGWLLRLPRELCRPLGRQRGLCRAHDDGEQGQQIGHRPARNLNERSA